jgi:hypothetical protein
MRTSCSASSLPPSSRSFVAAAWWLLVGTRDGVDKTRLPITQGAFIEGAVAEYLPLARIGTCLSRAWKRGRILREESAWPVLNMYRLRCIWLESMQFKVGLRRRGLAKSRPQTAPLNLSHLHPTHGLTAIRSWHFRANVQV